MQAHSRVLFASMLMAGAGSARADIFTWLAGSGAWENPAMWNGPAGQYPDSILDTATVSGQLVSATLNQNLAVGTLNILNGAAVYSGGNTVFVNADTQLIGAGSSLSVTESPSTRDFDTDTLTISAGILAMYNGLAQFDEALVITNNGGVLGTGILEMNSTSGNMDLTTGTIWAMAGAVGDTLRMRRTVSSTSRLNWTSAGASIIVWDGKTVHNELPYAGSLGGRISVSGLGGTARFVSDQAFVAGNGSELELRGLNSQSTARIEASAVDSYGHVEVTGYGVIDAPLVALRGTVALEADAFLSVPAGLLIFDSLNVQASVPGTRVQLAKAGSTLSVTGGLSSISMGAGSEFDLDGTGDKVVNIANGSTLSLDVGSIDIGAFPSFGGTLNIDGALHVAAHSGADTWRSNGQIVLDSGAITGRRIDNAGTVRGTGVIGSAVINNGEITADGGTLQLGVVDMDGDSSPANGVLRAQTGDLVMNMQANGASQFFTGSIFVGDGAGVREVLNADVNLVIRDQNGERGSMHLNSGFVVLSDFSNSGDLTAQGVSLLRTTGIDPVDRIEFNNQSVNTISGVLEVDGETWFGPDATFIGEGTIKAVSSSKRVFFQEDASLSDVSLVSAGEVHIWSLFQDNQATMGSLTLESTASLRVDMGDVLAPVTSERFVVLDNAHLDGTLVLDWAGNNDAPVGETVTILTASSISGAFDGIDDSGMGFNRRAHVTVGSNSIEVFVTCLADLNADGLANFFDLSAYLAMFNGMDPAADLNDDGLLNFFDVAIFVGRLQLGC